jgi:hypothetical protein
MSGTGPELGGSFALGPWRVHRAGYGAPNWVASTP